MNTMSSEIIGMIPQNQSFKGLRFMALMVLFLKHVRNQTRMEWAFLKVDVKLLIKNFK